MDHCSTTVLDAFAVSTKRCVLKLCWQSCYLKGLIKKPEDIEKESVNGLKEIEIQQIMRILETLDSVELSPGI